MPRLDRNVGLGCALLSLTQLVPAAWIVLAPHSFFRHLGRFGAYNPHYLGDAAAFQGGIGLVLLAAAWRPALRPGALAIGLASIGLHAINHWIDAGTPDVGLFDAISLTVLTMLAAALLATALRAQPR